MIYEWIREMEVFAEEEYVDPADLEVLVEKEIVTADLKQLALFDPVCGLSNESAGRTGGRYIFVFFTLCIS